MINFSETDISAQAVENIKQSLGNDKFENSYFTEKAAGSLENLMGCKKAFLTNSCTSALEMAAILLDLKSGDEVIMPSYTFVATASAFVLRGCVPVFVDIRKDTLNIDETKVEAAITEKTKAIVAVHYAGVGCDMDVIMQIAKKHDLYVIEDAAQGVLASYKEKPLGSFGHLSALSFHYTKNITSGLGGALLVNDESLIDRANIVWQKGTNRQAFLDGQVDKYTWVDVGSSFFMNEIPAALLCAQLDRVQEITEKRLAVWKQYHEAFSQSDAIATPYIPSDCEHNAHMYYLILQSNQQRSDFIAYMKTQGIIVTFHYVPLHTSPAGKTYCKTNGDLTVTEDLAGRLVRLPMHSKLRDAEVQKVISHTKSFLSSL